ncbi:hypothetical protein XELAEV_18002233mg [Xenopus laevis]|nr:hypothetical protein XELAEV_18002233mg [Xenopus laevis]
MGRRYPCDWRCESVTRPAFTAIRPKPLWLRKRKGITAANASNQINYEFRATIGIKADLKASRAVVKYFEGLMNLHKPHRGTPHL